MAETVSYICKPYFTCSSDFMSGVQTMCLLTSPKSSALPPPFPAALTMMASSRTCRAGRHCHLPESHIITRGRLCGCTLTTLSTCREWCLKVTRQADLISLVR
jgi:hypothetical protein